METVDSMEKYKPAIIAGGCACVLSLLIALVSGIGLPALVLRPLIFGAGFFLFGVGATLLFRRFLATDPKRTGVGGNVDVSVDDEDDLGIRNVGVGQGGEGLEQNSTVGYTGGGEGIDGSFKPMDFNILNESVDTNVDAVEEMLRSVDPPPAGNRKGYARVPEADSIANADPKKLAGAIQNLLLDE
ncbi:MAG: hypothetical protein LBT00_06200 [Spirochaetaceae bacterium]|jgi:hypothetical protein|nr:hypothetical protein [Spirochaetaceae bacterium]